MANIGQSLGELIFGQPKKKTVFGNDALARIQTDPDKYPQLLTDLIGSGKKATTGFASALDLGTPEAARIQGEDIANYDSLLKSGLAYNPADAFDSYLGATIGGPNGLRSWLPAFEGATNKAVSRRALAAGLNGTTNNAFNARVAAGDITDRFAPILNTIYGGAVPAAATLASNRLANIGSNVNLMRERAGIPDRMAIRSLLPFQTESDILGRQFDLSGKLGDATKANIQGYEMKSNPWANLTGSVVDEGLDLAKMYFGGGMGGMGGRPTPSLTPDNSIWGNQPSIFDRPAPTSYPGFDPYGNAVATHYPSLPNVWNVPPSQTMSYSGFDTGGYPVSNRYPVTPNFWGE